MMMKKMIFAAAVLTVLCSCGGKKGPVGERPLPEYPTMVMEAQTVILEQSYPVNIRGQVDVEVRPRIDGTIKSMFVSEGSHVRKGQSMFKIDSPQAEQGLATAQAAVASAQATLNTAKLNVDRMRPLAEQGIIGQVQLQTYENQYETAQAALAQAKASLSQSRSMVEWTNVLSPADGVVGSIPYREGNLVSSSMVLTTVADTRNVYAYFSLNEKELMGLLNYLPGETQAQKVQNMPEATLVLADGSTYAHKGRVEAISGVVNSNTGTATLRASFPNPEGLLKSGISGRLQLPRELDNVFEIPQKATMSLQDKVLVYKVQGDSVVRQVIDVQATSDGQRYAVTRGLEQGDRIVSDGVVSLAPGMKIKPAGAAAPTPQPEQ